jgi:class 3 adenylate cyclase
MSLCDELTTEVASIFRSAWTSRDGQKVPEAAELKLSNDSVKLDATVLYADLAESTNLVETEADAFAAEVYKAYLLVASKIVRRYGGEITAFDGDRIMAVFIGDSKSNNATRAALGINHAVVKIINPAIGHQYPSKSYRVRHAVGIDSSKLLVARTGIRNYNDLVWVGKAANIAAKLCSERNGSIATWISKAVYDVLTEGNKKAGSNDMWTQFNWTPRSEVIYGSSYYWEVSD